VGGSPGALDLNVSQGTAVLGLLERAKVPPLPSFYRLLYDYVSGVGSEPGRLRDILADASGVGDKLYAEFIAPYENGEAVERALARITARLRTLELLIGQSTEAAGEQAARLEEARVVLSGDRPSAALVREWVGRLQSANEEFGAANAALEQELGDAALELEATRMELEKSRETAKRDALTGLANRAGLDFAFARLIEVERSRSGSLSCAVIDVDHFKALNDNHGHPAGDAVLRLVAKALLASVRSVDIVGRSGGDEFIVILPDANLSAAHNIADGIRSALGAIDVRTVLGPETLGGITGSVGVAEFTPNDTIQTLLERADRCLYRAKQNGRNRVESFEDAARDESA
jgi:diguanylate cyclase